MRFRNTYKMVLFDMAEGFTNFESFKSEVERFYHEPDEVEECRWMEAFQELRSGKAQPESPFSSLPKEAPENRPTQITVERLNASGTRFTAADNIPDIYAQAA